MAQVLRDLSQLNHTMTAPKSDDLQALLAQALQRIQELESKPTRRVSFKVTDKGGVSAYGIGRFPVTLYKSQWEMLIQAGPELEAFLKTNAAKLTTKV